MAQAIPFEERFATMDVAQTQFVSKVYTTLAMALVVATGTCYAVAEYGSWQLALGMMIGALILGIISAFSRMKGLFGTILLWGYVICLGGALGPTINHFLKTAAGTQTLTMAIGLTAGIFLALTAFVRITGKDFSFMRGFLVIGTIGLCIAGVILMSYPGQGQYWYSLIGVLLFSGWILYDTSAVTRQYYEDNNVNRAVMELFLDIVNLFLMILRLLNSRD